VKLLHQRKLAQVTTDDVAALVRRLEQAGLSGNTVRNALIPLSAVFALATRRGWVSSNSVRGLAKNERPKRGNRPHRILSPAEIRRVLAESGDRWRTLFAVALFSGLRQSEILGLTWADVDMAAGRLLVRAQLERGTLARSVPKTDHATREVPVPPFVVRMLREHYLACRFKRPIDPVFAAIEGGPLDHRNVLRAWHVIRDQTKLAAPLPRFHDLRHTAASLLIAEGADPVYVSRMLGHSSPSITLNFYAGLFDRARHEERTVAMLEAKYAEIA
jgi:integrase